MVPRAVPAAFEGGAAFFALVPVALRMGGAAHEHLAHLAIADLAPLLIDEADLIARHRFAGGPVLETGCAVADVLVQHLGRADAVIKVDPELGAECLSH